MFRFGLLAAFLMASSSAFAQQVVVFDEHWVHGPDVPDSHFNVDVREGTPANFASPVNYGDGTLHLYMEVLSKPTDEPTHMVFCWNSRPTYSCAGQSPRFDGEGLVEWSTDVARFWRPGGQALDFAQGIRGMSAIVKDTENGKPTADNVGEEIAARFFPLELRMVATLVAPGSTYVPPEPYVPPMANRDGGVADGGMDAGLLDGGPMDAGTGGAPDLGAPDMTVRDAALQDVGAERDADFDASLPPFPEGGQTLEGSCAASGVGTSGLWILLLGFFRRRRRALVP